MADLNSFTLTGNVCKEPTYKQFGDDKGGVCHIRIASNGYKEGDVIYMDVDVYEGPNGSRAQKLSELVKVGAKIGATGALKVREHTNDEGVTRQYYSVRATEVQFLSKKGDSGNNAPAQDDGAPF